MDISDLKRIGRPAVNIGYVTMAVVAIVITAPLGAIGMDATVERFVGYDTVKDNTDEDD